MRWRMAMPSSPRQKTGAARRSHQTRRRPNCDLDLANCLYGALGIDDRRARYARARACGRAWKHCGRVGRVRARAAKQRAEERYLALVQRLVDDGVTASAL